MHLARHVGRTKGDMRKRPQPRPRDYTAKIGRLESMPTDTTLCQSPELALPTVSSFTYLNYGIVRHGRTPQMYRSYAPTA
ncbi:hypothetical protein SprV_0200712400 [Sparganum proliferum]